MGVVKGAISIKDNMTVVLRSIRQEQSAFRQDVEKTKKELQATWDKKRTAKLEATAASKAMDSLKKKMEPLRKKVVVATAVKGLATAKVKALGNQVKAVGKMVATPVVKVVTKGAQALSAIGKGFAQVTKAAAIGVGAVSAAAAAGLTALFSGSTELAKAQIEAETKLEAVLGNVASIQARGAGAAAQAKEKLMGVASELQQIGVIGDEVTLAGMQQLATFQLSEKEIATLAGGMTDLLAQQKGLNASQEDAVAIGNMIGKVMQGQTSALSRVGITFTEAQEQALKMGNAEQRAAVLAEILQQNVGGVNAALAQTDQGKIQQMANAWGDMKEEVGKVTLSIKGKFASVIMKNIPTVQKLGTTLMSTISKFADVAMPALDSVITHVTPVVEGALTRLGNFAESMGPVLSNVFGGLAQGAQTVKPVLDGIIKGFAPLLPQLVKFGTTVMGTVQQVAAAAMPAIASITTTVQSVIPSVLPVLETVVTTIGNVIAAAAPVIAGLVQGIGTVVSALAPVFQVIFDGIGQKVGSVLEFVGSKMGWIQNIIGTVAPVVADILITAWGVISPVMDLAISVFKLLFNVVQTVFNGIASVVSSVWSKVKPIVEGIGNGLSWVAGKVKGLLGMGGGDGGSVGSNAEGTNNWRGGPTWVGERGPELVDLPKGSRVLPNKESVQLAQNAARPVVREIFQTTTVEKPVVREVIQNTVEKPVMRDIVHNTVEKPAIYKTEGNSSPVLERIEKGLGVVTGLLGRDGRRGQDEDTPRKPPKRPDNGQDFPPPPDPNPKAPRPTAAAQTPLQVTVAKLADQIIVREDADIDRIGEAVAKRVVQAARNMAPA